MLRYLSDKLHDLSQVLLLLQDLLGFGAKGHKLGEVFVVILIQGARVLAVADQPVYGREVLPLSQLLIQTPEHLMNKTTQPLITSITRFCFGWGGYIYLYNAKGGRCNRVREVSTRR